MEVNLSPREKRRASIIYTRRCMEGHWLCMISVTGVFLKVDSVDRNVDLEGVYK